MKVTAKVSKMEEAVRPDGLKSLTLTVVAIADSFDDGAVEATKQVVLDSLLHGTPLERATNVSLTNQLVAAEKRIRDLTYQLGTLKAENAALRSTRGWRSAK